MTKLLVPILLVLLALALIPKNAQAPGAEINQGIRLLGYELRVGVSVQPVAATPPETAAVSDSLAETEAVPGEVPR